LCIADILTVHTLVGRDYVVAGLIDTGAIMHDIQNRLEAVERKEVLAAIRNVGLYVGRVSLSSHHNVSELLEMRNSKQWTLGHDRQMTFEVRAQRYVDPTDQ
jgi:hypothetical protein